MALVSTICPECHESVKVDDSKPFGFCFSCGAKIALAVPATAKQSGPSMEDTINNYVQLATNAKSAGNNEQCELYCNKILELDSSNAAAWALKASASGWQSSLANIRIDEMIIYYGNALKYARDSSQKASIKSLALDDYKNVVMGLLDLLCDRFSKWPDEDEAKRFTTFTLQYLQSSIKLLTTMQEAFDTEELSSKMCVKINNMVVNTENNLITNFVNSNSGHPTKFDLTTFYSKMGACESVLGDAETIGLKDYANCVVIIQNIIKNNNVCMQARGYSYERHMNYATDMSYYTWDPIYSLNQEAVNYRNNVIRKCQNKISEIERNQADNDNKAREECRKIYWNDHQEERKKLEIEKKALTKDLSELKEKMDKVREDDEIVQIESEVKILHNKRDSLGLFKIRDKKEIDALIAKKNEVSAALRNEKEAPFRNLIQEKESKLATINRRINADHPECENRSSVKVYKGTKSARLMTTIITNGR